VTDLQHVNVKIFATPESKAPWHELIPVFHRWIQQKAMPELLIDVADYAHVPGGPGVMLIGHEAFYSLDNRANRLGVLYNRRAILDGTPEEKVRQAWDSARNAAVRLSADLHGAVRFDEGDVEVFVNDRALAPNTQETLDAMAPVIRHVFGDGCAMEWDNDPRGLFRVRVRTDV
jgi:hypothetical protein